LNVLRRVKHNGTLVPARSRFLRAAHATGRARRALAIHPATCSALSARSKSAEREIKDVTF
jgi:hypothetical protein